MYVIADLAREIPGRMKDIGLDALGVKVRTRNALCAMGVRVLGDLEKYADHQIMRAPNFGKSSFEDLRTALAECATEGEAPGEAGSHIISRLVAGLDAESRGRSINHLETKIRTVNALSKEGIEAVGDLAEYTDADLMRIENFGKTSFEDLRAVLQRYGAGDPRVWRDEDDTISAAVAGLDSWRRGLPIDQVSMKPRTETILKSSGVRYVSDLIKYKDEEIRRFPGCGRATLSDIYEKVKDLKASGTGEGSRTKAPGGVDAKQIEIETNTGWSGTVYGVKAGRWDERFVDRVEMVLHRMGWRSGEVCRQRFGYYGKTNTLQAVADEIDVTRERVRQIQRAAVKSIKSNKGLEWEAVERVRNLLANRQVPLYVRVLGTEDSWFRHETVPDVWFRGILDAVMGNTYHVITVNDRAVVTAINSNEWNSLLKYCTRKLAAEAERNTYEPDIVEMIRTIVRSYDASELEMEVWESLDPKCRWTINGGDSERQLWAFGQKITDYIKQELGSAESPLHYTEITRRIAQRLGNKNFSERAVHVAVARVGAYLVSPGTFGMRHHLGLSERGIEKMVNSAKELLEVNAGRQWHVHEILYKLQEKGVGYEGKLTAQVLDSVLKDAEGLIDLGNQVWRVRDSHEEGSRFGLVDMCRAVLDEAGTQLTRDEIVRRIGKRRGVSRTFQVPLGAGVVQVSPGEWGLIERDVDLSRYEIRVALDVLEKAIREYGLALAVKEIPYVIAEHANIERERVNRYALYSLCRTDGRFRIVYGGKAVSLNEDPIQDRTVADVISDEWMRHGEPEQWSLRSAVENVLRHRVSNGRLRVILEEIQAKP